MERANAALRRVPTGFVWVAAFLPMAWLFWLAATGGLGAEPVRALEHGIGEWGLRLLMLSLAVSPMTRVGLRLVRFRRALGVSGFAYVVMHFAVWIALDMGFRWSQVAGDLSGRPYIIVGAVALLLMLPLAVTSTDGWVRRMGAVAWRRLHRLAYPAVLLGAIHFVMVGKVWVPESLVYLAITLALLGERLLPRRTMNRRPGASRPA